MWVIWFNLIHCATHDYRGVDYHCVRSKLLWCTFLEYMDSNVYHPRKRGDNVFTLCVCLCVCVCVVVYVCHDVCPDDLTLKDWCHTNNILQVHCWGCLVVQVMIHALMTSLMTSQDHKVGQILKLIYLRQCLSYSVDQKLKMSEMLMAIFLVYSTSGTTSGKKFVASSKWRPFWKILNIKHSFNFTSDMKRSSQIMHKKSIFLIMTSSMTSQGGLKVDLLYSFMNEITTFFMITKKQAKISWLDFLSIGIMRLWLQLYKYIFMTSLMTSPGRKIGKVLKLIYLRQYLS